MNADDSDSKLGPDNFDIDDLDGFSIVAFSAPPPSSLSSNEELKKVTLMVSGVPQPQPTDLSGVVAQRLYAEDVRHNRQHTNLIDITHKKPPPQSCSSSTDHLSSMTNGKNAHSAAVTTLQSPIPTSPPHTTTEPKQEPKHEAHAPPSGGEDSKTKAVASAWPPIPSPKQKPKMGLGKSSNKRAGHEGRESRESKVDEQAADEGIAAGKDMIEEQSTQSLYHLHVKTIIGQEVLVSWCYPPGNPGDNNAWIGLFPHHEINTGSRVRFKMITKNLVFGCTRFPPSSIKGLKDGTYKFALQCNYFCQDQAAAISECIEVKDGYPISQENDTPSSALSNPIAKDNKRRIEVEERGVKQRSYKIPKHGGAR